MIIIGAKGFAKEVLEAFDTIPESLYFFDNISSDLPTQLYNRFPILKSLTEVKSIFSGDGDRSFALGLGGPQARLTLSNQFEAMGGDKKSIISPKATIGKFQTYVGKGCNIMTGVVITNDVSVDEGCLINLNVTIGHDTVIGKFVEISPGANISGRCIVGDFCNIGTNAVLLPGVTLGRNVIVGAGSVVTKNVPDDSLVVGVPAVVKKSIAPIKFSALN